jgi:two-component system, chemotaxis family, response regulator Rcp1
MVMDREGQPQACAIRGRPIEVLLVEDNPGDIRLTLEAFKDGKFRNTVHVVTNGIDAMAFLHQEGPYAQASRPDLILLDLNLPGKDGREILAEIKQDPQLREIPVVILTASKAEEDILRAYQLQASCYIAKPVDLAQFLSVVRAIGGFWLEVVTLPPA